MKTKPSTEYALLGALMAGAKHGYEIMQFIETAMGHTWYVGASQLYVLLKKLEQDGFLRSSMETQGTRPPKRVFSLWQAGKKSFLDECNLFSSGGLCCFFGLILVCQGEFR